MRTLADHGRAGRRLAMAAVAVILTAGAAQASVITDDFNRPDGPDMGPLWTVRYRTWRIEDGMARSEIGEQCALMTVNEFQAPEPVVEATVRHDGPGRPTYVALVSLYLNLRHNVFVKVQDNNLDGLYDIVWFYEGNNSQEVWPGFTGGKAYAEVAPFAEARLRTTIVGDEVTLTIDRNFDGMPDTPDDVITRGGIPVASLGLGVGLGGYNDAAVDDFLALPEPATLLFLGLGLAGLVVRRRRSA